MKTSVERLEGNVVKITVSVDADEVGEAIDSTYKDYSARLKVPGFRQGKAPKPVVDSYVGKDIVYGEATESLVQDTYPKAVDAEGLRPIEQPKVGDLEPVKPGEGYEWSAEVQVRPELTLSSIEGIEVAVPSPEATDADIDLRLMQLRDRYASIGPVEDRGVGDKDFVLLSFVGYVDGETYEGNQVDKYLYQTRMGSLPLEFDDGIAGMMPGDERRVEFTISEESANPEFVGKTAQFDVTVHEIKAQTFPEIDDAFAGQLGYDTLDEVRGALKEQVDREKSLHSEQSKERLLRAELAERLEGDVPEVMVSTRKESMMRDFMTGLETRGLSVQQYLEITRQTDEELVADVERQAEQGIKEDLALEALFRQLEMGVTDEDVEEELDLLASATSQDKEQTRAQWQDIGLMSVLHEQVMHRKAVNWLLENATIEIAEDESAATDDAAVAEADAPKKRRAKSTSKKKEPAAETSAATGEQSADAEADEAAAGPEGSEE